MLLTNHFILANKELYFRVGNKSRSFISDFISTLRHDGWITPNIKLKQDQVCGRVSDGSLIFKYFLDSSH